MTDSFYLEVNAYHYAVLEALKTRVEQDSESSSYFKYCLTFKIEETTAGKRVNCREFELREHTIWATSWKHRQTCGGLWKISCGSIMKMKDA